MTSTVSLSPVRALFTAVAVAPSFVKSVSDGDPDLQDFQNHLVQEFIWMFPKIGVPQSSILIGFSITNHPFWGTPIVGNTHMDSQKKSPAKFEGQLLQSKIFEAFFGCVPR